MRFRVCKFVCFCTESLLSSRGCAVKRTKVREGKRTSVREGKRTKAREGKRTKAREIMRTWAQRL